MRATLLLTLLACAGCASASPEPRAEVRPATEQLATPRRESLIEKATFREDQRPDTVDEDR